MTMTANNNSSISTLAFLAVFVISCVLCESNALLPVAVKEDGSQPKSNAIIAIEEKNEHQELPAHHQQQQPEIVFYRPHNGQKIPLWENEAHVAVALKWNVRGMDLAAGGKACFLLRGQNAASSDPYTCLKKVAIIDATELGVGTWVVESVLYNKDDTIVFNSTISFSVVAAHPFEVSYEYNIIEDWHSIPAGMEIQLPLDGIGRKRARIPAEWPLQLYLGDDIGFYRPKVRREMTVKEVRTMVAEHVGVTVKCVAARVPRSTEENAKMVDIDDNKTVEQVNWFMNSGIIKVIVTTDTPQCKPQPAMN